jgi:putative ABC transport system substrate-binding protein
MRPARARSSDTRTVPIVFVGGDPIDSGTLKNPARPEGNTTGFAATFGSLGGKWIQLPKEVAPNITRVGFVFQPPNSGGVYRPSIEAAARSFGVQLIAIPISDAASMKAAIERFTTEPNGGLIPTPGLSPIATLELIRLAAQYRLPVIAGGQSFTADGGLMSYDSDPVERIREAAGYVDRLLRGANVSELPVQYPTQFRLVVNLRAAKSIGLTIPESLLLRADQVIE